MFPVSKPELSFADISEYWGPELKLSRDRAQALLEEAFWLGEISIALGITRLELLKRLVKWMRNCDSPDIVFVTPESTPPPKTMELTDHIDLRPRVVVPSGDAETWTEESCDATFEAMSEITSLQHYAEWSPGFHATKLTRDEFFKLIALRDFPYPMFWKRANHEMASINLRPAQDRVIVDEIRRVYDRAHIKRTKPPNINEVVEPVQARLREMGQTASAAQIKKIGEKPEFKNRRRPPGKTLRSEKRVPQK
jgi:hypothetical protein